MTLKVGINGFGRIGRMALRSIIEQNRKDLEVVAINNRSDAETSAFLLVNDTIHGKLKSKISHSEKAINIDGKKINMIHKTEISNEAGSVFGWEKYVGPNGISLGMKSFGKSAPYKKIYEHFNLTSDNIVKLTKKMLDK